MKNVLTVVEVVPYVVGDSDVAFEAHCAGVESSFVQVADYAAAIEVVLAGSLLSADQ